MKTHLLFIFSFFLSLGLIAQNCELGGLIAEAHECDGDSYLLDVDLNEYNNTSDSFLLTVGGDFIGTYAYDDLFVTVGPFVGSGGVISVVIEDQDDPNCLIETEYEAPQCIVDCGFDEIEVTEIECTSDSTINFVLYFNHFGTGELGFDLFDYNDDFFGFYLYEDLPVIIENWVLNEAYWQDFKICDNDDLDCCHGWEFETPNCDDECVINAEIISTDCDGDILLVTFEVACENGSGEYEVVGNGNNYGSFSCNENQITIENIETEGIEVLEFIFTDVEFGDCQAVLELENPCSNSECEFGLDITSSECSGDSAIVTIEVECPEGIEEYVVYGNGEEYGTFDCEEGTITITTTSNNEELEFIFEEVDTEDCITDIGIENPCNEECGFSNIEVYDFECHQDGTFDFILNFDYQGTGELGFDLYDDDGNFHSFHLYSDLPVLVQFWEPRNLPFEYLKICDNDNLDCCQEFEFEGPDCEEDCAIYAQIVSTECMGDSLMVTFGVSCENGSGEYEVGGNGNDYGTFNCNDSIITIGYIETEGIEVLEFIFTDIEFPDCQTEVILDNPCSGECGFNQFEITEIECTSDSTYSFVLNFNYFGTNEFGFDLFDEDGNLHSFYEYSELPVQVTNWPERDLNFQFLKVCDNDNLDCCQEYEFEAPNCDDECNISAQIITTECIGDSLVITFGVSCENGSGEYEVVGNGNDYGTFSCNSPTITITVNTEGLEVLEFIFGDVEFPDCQEEIELENPCGNNGECEFGVQVIEELCEGDSIIISFVVECPEGVEEFVVYGNGEEYGVFDCQEGEVTITTISNETYLEFIFEDVDDEECNTEIELNNPCLEECGFEEINVFEIECTSDSTINFMLSFEYFGTGELGFDLFDEDGNLIGFYEYDDLPVLVEDFPLRNSVFQFIKICDNDNLECCQEFEFEWDGCDEDECGIDVEVISTECMGDSLMVTFSVYCENGSGEYEVGGNGNDYGTFSCGDSLISIGYIETEGIEILEFVFTDVEFGDCQAVVEFENPCDIVEECEFALEVIEASCSGDSVIVTIEVECPEGVEEYVVFGNGEEYGVFGCDESPITIITTSDASVLEFIFEEVNTEDCGTEVIVDNPCVEIECEIDDLVAEAHACDSLSEFLVDIDFEYNGTSDSFLLEINGESYGCYAYSDLFITVGPFTPNTPFLDIYVQDKEDEECSAETQLEAPECFGEPCVEEMVIELETTECEGETYMLHVDLMHIGDSKDFEISIGDFHQGIFNSDEFPIVLGPFLGEGDEEFVNVRQVGGQLCSWIEEYTEPLCVTSVSRPEVKEFSWLINQNEIVLSKDVETLDRRVIVSDISGRILDSSTWVRNASNHSISSENLISGLYILYVEGYQGEKIVLIK